MGITRVNKCCSETSAECIERFMDGLIEACEGNNRVEQVMEALRISIFNGMVKDIAISVTCKPENYGSENTDNLLESISEKVKDDDKSIIKMRKKIKGDGSLKEKMLKNTIIKLKKRTKK